MPVLKYGKIRGKIRAENYKKLLTKYHNMGIINSAAVIQYKRPLQSRTE